MGTLDKNIMDRYSLDNFTLDKYKLDTNVLDGLSSFVANWKFDEPSGFSCFDSSGNGFTGAATGTTIIAGFIGNARRFSGGTDKIDFTSKIIPLGAKTIKFYIKRNGNPSPLEVIMSNCSDSTEHGFDVFIDSTGHILWNSFKSVNGVTRFTITSSAIVTDNSWHLVKVTWDGTVNPNGINLYIDNMVTPNAQSTANIIETVQSNNNLRIGQLYGSTTYTLNADLDDIEISNVVR